MRSVKVCLPTDIRFNYPTVEYPLTIPILKLHKFIKGPKYRENSNTSWKAAKARIMRGFIDCIDTRCNKQDIDKSFLTEWKYKVISNVD